MDILSKVAPLNVCLFIQTNSVSTQVYTAVPFNGWYANTEVLRDLTDEGRYNMLIPVAKTLRMDPSLKPGEAPFWKDEVMNILSMAVYHSYKSAKVAMIDHHSLIDMFWAWYGDEMLTRKYCPVNWKWVIVSRLAHNFQISCKRKALTLSLLFCFISHKPPMCSTTNQAYLGLSKVSLSVLSISRTCFQDAFKMP